MGGTMEWARLRDRNGLPVRKMEGDPYLRTDDQVPKWLSKEVNAATLMGEMNRLEQSYMGVYYEGQTDLPGIGARQAGITRDQALAFLRWFFELPEEGCMECQKRLDMNQSPSTHQRCYEHTWGPYQ